MKNLLFLIILLFVSNVTIGQNYTLEQSSCNKLLLLSSKASKFSKTYVLEKQVADNSWQNVRTIKTQNTSPLFKDLEDGNYRMVVHSHDKDKVYSSIESIKCTVDAREAAKKEISVYPNSAHHYVNIEVDNRGDKNEISVYPNPAHHYVNIETDNLGDDHAFSYTLCTVEGKVIQKECMHGNLTKVWLNNVPEGLMFLTVFKRGERYETIKLFIN